MRTQLESVNQEDFGRRVAIIVVAGVLITLVLAVVGSALWNGHGWIRAFRP